MTTAKLGWPDLLAILLIVLGIVELGVVVEAHVANLPVGVVATAIFCACYAIASLATIFALRGRFGNGARTAARLLVIAALIAGAVTLKIRWPEAITRSGNDVGVITDSALSALPETQQLGWAVRVAAQAMSTIGPRGDTILIPITWPMPPGIAIGAKDMTDSFTLRAIQPDTKRWCAFTIYRRIGSTPRAGRGEPVTCGKNASGDYPLKVVRAAWQAPAEPPAPPMPRGAKPPATWEQYRRDAARTAAVDGAAGPAAGWRTTLEGEMRASASFAGGRVLIGTHGPGAMHAIDPMTGQVQWMRYVANWIHQDAASDGRTVVIGFGNNWDSLFGDAPSGVAAFSLATGALKWSAFEGNAVMTSAVIWRGNAVSVTSAGALSVRDLETGAERAQMKVPGRATMAPTVLVGDTLVATLDSSRVCAVDLTAMKQSWCTDLPGTGMVGHSAATVSGGRVYLTAALFDTHTTLGFSRFNWLRIKQTLGWDRIDDYEYQGMKIYSLDLSSGKIVWESKLYHSQNLPRGHSSGTPIIEDGVGVVLLPLAGRMVGFDLATGAEKWEEETGLTRGPPAHRDGKIYEMQRAGRLKVVRAATGATECVVKTMPLFDRSGGVIAGNTLYLGSIAGNLYAVPLAAIDACDEKAITAIVK